VQDVASRRLRAQRLTGEPFASPVDAVRALGAVQSQDYGAARWALGQRTGATAVEIDRLFDRGEILRTHVLRPTWHFVLPEDIDRLLRLTAPRILAGLAARHRQLGVDKPAVAKACAAFEMALAGGRHLTRPELGAALEAAGISPEGQRLPHLLLCAELQRLVCSGPRRGRQLTWALLSERAPRPAAFDHDEAVRDLARRYFQSHGPAQLQDFAWWSGLTVSQARLGVELAGPDLEREEIDGLPHWFGAGADRSPAADREAHLLPNFDEYLVAYRDRSAALHPGQVYDPADFAFGSILSNVVLVGGRVRGSWRRTGERRSVRIELRLPGDLRPAERRAVEVAAEEARRFYAEAS